MDFIRIFVRIFVFVRTKLIDITKHIRKSFNYGQNKKFSLSKECVKCIFICRVFSFSTVYFSPY